MQKILGLTFSIVGAISTSLFNSSHAAELTCAEVISKFDRFPELIDLVECKSAPSSQLRTLEARYRVEGSKASAVEKFLQQEYDLPSLRFVCCGWSSMTDIYTGEHTPNFAIYEDSDRNYYKIRMMSEETLIVDRQKWSDIPWFYVTVVAYLEMP